MNSYEENSFINGFFIDKNMDVIMNRVLLLIVSFFFIALVPRTPAQTNYAINFQNLNYMSHGDFVYCGSPNYGFTNELTVALWVKWTTDPKNFSVTPTSHENEGQYSTYIGYGSHNSTAIGSDNGQFWFRNSKVGNKIEFLIQNTSNATGLVDFAMIPVSGTWYYLTGVYNGSQLKLYVDGIEKGSTNFSGNIRANDLTHRLNMGRLPWGYGFFVGYMDDVRIWNKALTAAEVLTQMTSPTTVQSDYIKSYWNFNSGTGTIIDDSGPQNADGIFYSALVDVHSTGSNFPGKIIADGDKTWEVNYWAGHTLKTVSGAGIDETNTIISNTTTTMTLQYGFGGISPDNRTTPVFDGTANDTWFGVEKTGETSQWALSDAPLPVELTLFEAQSLGNEVHLIWTTATEVQNYGFEIERSDDGTTWNTIGFVQGNGNSNSAKQYAYSDVKIHGFPVLYYRLKQIDTDGTFAYSPTIRVINTVSMTAHLEQNYPNPFNPETVINISLPQDVQSRLEVFNPLGESVAVLADGVLAAGEHTFRFDGKGLSAGIYFCRLTAGEYIKTRKMHLLH